jgi:hypothetical protein
MGDRFRVGPVLLVMGLAIAVLVAGVPAVGAVIDPGRQVASAAKKKRSKKCRKGKVLVKLGRRRSCLPLRKALPRPRAGDSRIAYINAALDFDFSKAREGRRRRGPSLKKVFRKQLGPKALPLLKRAMPQALALLDRRRAASGATRAERRAHTADFMPTPDGFSFSVGDLKLEVRVPLVGQLAAEFALTQKKNGKRVRATVRPVKDSRFEWECPDDKGVMNAKDGFKQSVTVETLNIHDGTDSYWTESVGQSTKMTGKMGDDGKLDTVELKDKVEIEERVGGPESDIGNAAVRATIVHETTINMRTGAYDAGQSSVKGDSQVSGLLGLFQSSFEANALARLKKAADAGFANTVDKAIKGFREAEKPNRCVKITFDPESTKKKQRKGQTGTVNATLAGEKASNATGKWTLKSSENGSFSPSSGQGHQLLINYTVTGLEGAQIKATYRAVGKSGVAEETWTQDIQAGIRHISGTIQGHRVEGSSIFDWQGNAAFDFDESNSGFGNFFYKNASGDFTVVASGIGPHACAQSGTKHFVIPAGTGGLYIPNTSSDPSPPPPYQYSFGVAIPGSSTMDVTLSSCPNPPSPYEGTVEAIDMSIVYDSNGFHVTSDGIDFTSSWSTSGDPAETQSWSFHGTP